MRFMYQYPEVHGSEDDLRDAGPVPEVARAAEEAGFEGISFTEHPIPGARWLDAGGHQTLDPFIALAASAGATNRIRLLTCLAVAPYRNPFLLAKTAASLDIVSGGRFILGLGTGYHKTEFFALGVDFDERNALFDEALEVLPLHWRGEPFSYEGRHFNARDVIARPRPIQDPIPIWIGGNAQVTRRRVADHAQGWMPLLGSETLNQTTRTPSLGGREGIAAAMKEIRDRGAARGEFDLLYPYAEPISVTDDPARHRDAIAEIEEMGATWACILGHTTTRDSTLAFLEWFGANVIAP